MATPRKEVSITVRISLETKTALQGLAERGNRKLSDYVRLLLEQDVKLKLVDRKKMGGEL